MAVTGRRGRKVIKLLEELKKYGGYWILKEEVLDCTLEKLIWRSLWNCRKTAYGKKRNVRLTGFYSDTLLCFLFKIDYAAVLVSFYVRDIQIFPRASQIKFQSGIINSRNRSNVLQPAFM